MTVKKLLLARPHFYGLEIVVVFKCNFGGEAGEGKEFYLVILDNEQPSHSLRATQQ